jgi:transcription elongation GreA/GreB family factor
MIEARNLGEQEVLNPNSLLNAMTTGAYESLKKSLEEAQTQLAKAQQDVGEAGGTSDWHDNFALEEAHRQIDLWSSAIRTRKAQLDNVVFIQPRVDVSNVGLGNKIVLKFEGESENETFLILGPVDAVFRKGCLSYKTPIGQRILGATSGKTIEFEVGDQTTKVKVVKILPGDF